ncbi:MAG: DinB family protein, partial [Phycisphaeraceae bacterium]|nr:DinB family protein [Phycisphaeraceae bacterium]
MNVMNAAWMIDRLERFPQSLVALLSGIADEDARWRPGPQHWSMLEIVCHLV